MREFLLHKLKHNLKRARTAGKWIVVSILIGGIVGGAGTFFSFSLSFVNLVREKNPWLIWLLPVGGLLIVGAYRLLHDEKDAGTNLVISAIQSGDHLPFRMAPLIFLSTLITHLFGGSAGREGAALQLGGSIGNGIGSLFRFDEKDRHIMIMCGMSAAFSALFGTPMAAAFFSMEVISVGIMHYAALVPCVVSSLIAHEIAASFGVQAEAFRLAALPAFSVRTAVLVVLLAILCALLSILFCVLMHQTEHCYKKLFKNPYVRVFAGGCVVVLLTLLVGSQRYSGAGIDVITECMRMQTIVPETFVLKMLFTALTLGAGFKGGEIVPSFCSGAAFGCLYGSLVGLNPALCTAVGMCAVFCGVTNCPVTSLLISFELFGYEGMPYFLLTVAFSYMLSGYFGLYRSQKIIYSKYKTNYINKKTT